MSKVTQYIISLTTDGSGDASVSTSSKNSSPPRGRILAIYVDYSATAAGTTDITIADAAGQTIYAKTDYATDGWIYPRAYLEDTSGTDLTYDGTRKIPDNFIIFSHLTATIAQGGATKTSKVYIYVEEY